MPYTRTASTAPKVKTPARPSRNTALASRNQTVRRSTAQSSRRSRHSTRYEPSSPARSAPGSAVVRGSSGTANITGSAKAANHTAASTAISRMLSPSSVGMPSSPRVSPSPAMKPK
ncbi:Uncharacterised protein [Mycobacteroides abscessus subsp. abscessus]|nr:Uncharacterised protein [Mycobacteroides abscessus subsp. abscessus]